MHATRGVSRAWRVARAAGPFRQWCGFWQALDLPTFGYRKSHTTPLGNGVGPTQIFRRPCSLTRSMTSAPPPFQNAMSRTIVSGQYLWSHSEKPCLFVPLVVPVMASDHVEHGNQPLPTCFLGCGMERRIFPTLLDASIIRTQTDTGEQIQPLSRWTQPRVLRLIILDSAPAFHL